MSVSRRVFGRFFFLHKSKKGGNVVEKRSRKTKNQPVFLLPIQHDPKCGGFLCLGKLFKCWSLLGLR